jgi:sigma-E factor negative regulatory protein RseA
MSNEELDSQLSAMFDDELPKSECELLAKRLSRDPALKARWGRYALINAAARAEHGLRLDNEVAQRVAAVLAAEPAPAQSAARAAAGLPSSFSGWRGVARWREAVGGIAVAAGVAALSIFWLRSQQVPNEPLLADDARSAPGAVIFDSREPASYTVPAFIDAPTIVPTAELANYVVAHSEFSGPLVRRNTLSTLVGSDAGTADDAAALGDSEPEPDADRSADAPRNR